MDTSRSLKVAVPEAAIHEAPYFPDKEMTDFLASLGGMLGGLGELRVGMALVR